MIYHLQDLCTKALCALLVAIHNFISIVECLLCGIYKVSYKTVPFENNLKNVIFSFSQKLTSNAQFKDIEDIAQCRFNSIQFKYFYNS